MICSRVCCFESHIIRIAICEVVCASYGGGYQYLSILTFLKHLGPLCRKLLVKLLSIQGYHLFQANHTALDASDTK